MISSESVEKKEPVIPRQTPRTPIHSGWASASVASVAFMGNCASGVKAVGLERSPLLKKA